MKKFIRKISLYLLSLIILLALCLTEYFINDPFKVIYDYPDYSNWHVPINRDYVSTEMFLKNYKKYKYNSYILGSSRSHSFSPKEWKKYLGKEDYPFSFDSSGESLFGIYKKVKFLDSMHAPIDNLLIVICRDATFARETNHTGHLYKTHPAVSGEGNIDFQKTFIRAYFNPLFLVRYYDFRLTKKIKGYMNKYIEPRRVVFDSVTNEHQILDRDEELQNTPKEYYAKRKKIFYKRPDHAVTDTVERIKATHLSMLNEMKEIIEKNKTNVTVVISPLYDQIQINPSDLKKIQATFGKNVYDLSGKNSFTEPMTNYYESSHYIPAVGKAIMSKIYK